MLATELRPNPCTPRLPALACLLVVAVMTMPNPGLAQTGPVITEADMEQARRAQPVITQQDIDQAQHKHRMPGDAELEGAQFPSRPDIDALPQPLTSTPIDLEALARGYAAQTDAMQAQQSLASGPALLVFVSLTMPQPTLQRLFDQAARAGATLYLRGFKNGSLRETVAQVQALIGARRVALQIDPQAFDRFSITQVPSFVLIRAGAQVASCAGGACALPQDFLRSAGDVSLDYALEHMQRAAPRMRSSAAPFIRRIKRIEGQGARHAELE